ncbi:MAG: DUF1614 domain-containing protein [Betaproteobacteria bacterium]|nr:DUF1614 domain-containing protein [Betaproteobacteria bacterium]
MESRHRERVARRQRAAATAGLSGKLNALRRFFVPFSPLRLLLLIAAFILLVIVVQFGVVSVAFEKLGLSSHSAYLLLLATLIGSTINLPLFSVRSEGAASPVLPPELARLPLFRKIPFTGRTTVVVNVGGALIPLVFSFYLIAHRPLSPFEVLAAIGVVAGVAHAISRPIPGVGIAMPVFIAPVAAALVAWLLNPEQRAPLAYIGGSLGVLIGADLVRLKDLKSLGAPVASIGGAGTFDGIFITGFVAVLLA